MYAKCLLVLCTVVLTGSALPAQSDPISGKWGRDGATVLDLKLESSGVVSGQVMNGRPGNMAAITSGTFDRQHGTLKLRGEAKHPDSGALIAWLIDGALVGDSLKVNATFGDYKGSMAVIRLGTGQSTEPNVLDGLRGGFDEVHTAVSKSAELVPADTYMYRPVSTVRTFGELVAHIADSYGWYCSRAAGRNVQWSDAIEKGNTDKATVTRKLRESLAVCTAAYGNGSSNLGTLMANIAHANLHYGNMITYLRMMGLVPPTNG
jgi:uncharacterized damage-inducible protein DinB